MQSDGETDTQEYGKYKTRKRKEYLNDFSAHKQHSILMNVGINEIIRIKTITTGC